MVPTKIGIRQLVEFILRSGDLNPTANSQNTALKGAQIHRRLQKSGAQTTKKNTRSNGSLRLLGRNLPSKDGLMEW